MPDICPVLALGLYLIYFGASIREGFLFPGLGQSNRFGTLFFDILKVIVCSFTI